MFARVLFQIQALSCRSFSATSSLERSLSKKGQRIPKGYPKRCNPFMFRYTKRGQVIRLKLWNIKRDEYKQIPFDKEKIHEFGLNPKDVHEVKWGGSKALRQRIGLDTSMFSYCHCAM